MLTPAAEVRERIAVAFKNMVRSRSDGQSSTIDDCPSRARWCDDCRAGRGLGVSDAEGFVSQEPVDYHCAVLQCALQPAGGSKRGDAAIGGQYRGNILPHIGMY